MPHPGINNRVVITVKSTCQPLICRDLFYDFREVNNIVHQNFGMELIGIKPSLLFGRFQPPVFRITIHIKHRSRFESNGTIPPRTPQVG